LDLLLNKDVFEIFLKRAKIIKEIRTYLDQKGFIEFETPVLQPVYGGANAKPFITLVNSIKQNYYMRISDELYLKRLLIGGYSKVYEIGKDFRNEDIDSTHNPEFTMIEIYDAYKDYNDMMDLAEEMLKTVTFKVNGSYIIDLKDHKLDLSKPWRRVTMYSLLREKGIDPKIISDTELEELVSRHEIKLVKHSRGLTITKLFETLCEKDLIEPTFVIDYPKESTALCKTHRSDPDLIERFELYINGIELANGYSELNDPIKQEQNLKEENSLRNLGYEEAQQFDQDFIDALRVGMPNAGGIGIGIDRVVRLLTAQESLKEVLLYPILAVKKEEK
jgi:lysyl-tRNA synthetase class 2